MNKTQKEIVFSMIIYLFSRIAIITCEKNYENEFQNDNNNSAPVFFSDLLFILVVLIIVIFFSFCLCKEKKMMKLIDDKNNLGTNIKLFMSSLINRMIILFQIILVFYINIIIEFFYSLYNLFLGEDINSHSLINLYNSLFLISIFLFLLNFYCLITAKYQADLEIIFSPTIIISIYYTIINSFISLIKSLIKDIKILLYIQFITNSIFLLFLAFLFFKFLCSIINRFCCGNNCPYTCCEIN